MNSKVKFLFCFLQCSVFSYSTTAPFINKCKIPDDGCVTASAQAALPTIAAGIPEFNMPTLDPFNIGVLNVTNPNLRMVFSDVVAEGMRNCHMEKVSATQSKILGRGICTINMEGKYVVDGKILIVPLNGKGTFHIKLNKIAVNAEADIYTVVGKDGKKHWKFHTFTHSFQLLGKSNIKLDNLFDGNQVLSKAVSDVLDNNANDVIQELAPPVVSQLATVLANSLKHLYQHVPLEDLTIS